MEYGVYSVETDTLLDVLDFTSESQIKKFKKDNPDKYLESEIDLEDDLIDDEYLTEDIEEEVEWS